MCVSSLAIEILSSIEILWLGGWVLGVRGCGDAEGSGGDGQSRCVRERKFGKQKEGERERDR